MVNKTYTLVSFYNILPEEKEEVGRVFDREDRKTKSSP